MKGWVNGVAAHLETAFPAADVVRGQRDGVWRDDQDLIAVWWPGWDELSRDTALASPTLTIRYFPRRSVQPDEAVPADPDPLLDAADALLAAFDRASAAVGFFTSGLSCRLSRVAPDYRTDVWRVDATLVAYTLGAAG
jgi:hypothetical protein